MPSYTCCFTGHRDLPADQLPSIEKQLRDEIEAAIFQGYRHFLCGFAKGADVLFAKLVLEAQKRHPAVTLEAALPYRAFLSRRSGEDQALLAQCQTVGVHSEGYHPFCFSLRNRYMVAQSALVLAVYDGRSQGGTASTLRYAQSLGLEVRALNFS